MLIERVDLWLSHRLSSHREPGQRSAKVNELLKNTILDNCHCSRLYKFHETFYGRPVDSCSPIQESEVHVDSLIHSNGVPMILLEVNLRAAGKQIPHLSPCKSSDTNVRIHGMT